MKVTKIRNGEYTLLDGKYVIQKNEETGKWVMGYKCERFGWDFYDERDTKRECIKAMEKVNS